MRAAASRRCRAAATGVPQLVAAHIAHHLRALLSLQLDGRQQPLRQQLRGDRSALLHGRIQALTEHIAAGG